jgi:hypothetical protein
LPIFKKICRQVYDSDEAIASFRTMFFNKPANQGTPLPWHQDRWIHLDRDPKVTMYTAIDSSNITNGCVKLIPGSHKLGVINPSHHSAFLTEEQTQQHCPEDRIGKLLQDFMLTPAHFSEALPPLPSQSGAQGRRGGSASQLDHPSIRRQQIAKPQTSFLC